MRVFRATLLVLAMDSTVEAMPVAVQSLVQVPASGLETKDSASEAWEGNHSASTAALLRGPERTPGYLSNGASSDLEALPSKFGFRGTGGANFCNSHFVDTVPQRGPSCKHYAQTVTPQKLARDCKSNKFLELCPSTCCTTTSLAVLQGHDELPDAPPTAFCFLVRDAEDYLERNLRKLERIAQRCRDYRIFYVENDSHDRTRAILAAARKANHRILGEHLVLGVKYSTAQCTNPKQKNCASRINLLAALRQRVLSHALSWNPTHLVMVDLDFVSFDPGPFWEMQAVLSSFALDGVCGTSMIHSCRYFPTILSTQHSKPIIYDIGALLPYSLRNNERVLAKGSLTRAKSAFGGACVYDAHSLRRSNASYTSKIHTSGDIEHLAFNKHLRRLFVYPSYPEYASECPPPWFDKAARARTKLMPNWSEVEEQGSWLDWFW